MHRRYAWQPGNRSIIIFKKRLGPRGKVILDVEELKKYLVEKKNNGQPPLKNELAPVAKTITKNNSHVPAKTFQKPNPFNKLSKENNDALQKFKQQLVFHPVG